MTMKNSTCCFIKDYNLTITNPYSSCSIRTYCNRIIRCFLTFIWGFVFYCIILIAMIICFFINSIRVTTLRCSSVPADNTVLSVHLRSVHYTSGGLEYARLLQHFLQMHHTGRYSAHLHLRLQTAHI